MFCRARCVAVTCMSIDITSKNGVSIESRGEWAQRGQFRRELELKKIRLDIQTI